MYGIWSACWRQVHHIVPLANMIEAVMSLLSARMYCAIWKGVCEHATPGCMWPAQAASIHGAIHPRQALNVDTEKSTRICVACVLMSFVKAMPVRVLPAACQKHTQTSSNGHVETCKAAIRHVDTYI